jgi:hypothetical protein
VPRQAEKLNASRQMIAALSGFDASVPIVPLPKSAFYFSNDEGFRTTLMPAKALISS